MGAIGSKLVAKMTKAARGKVVNLQAFAAGKASAAELQRSVVSSADLAGLDPVHALYVYAQNQVSVMTEQLCALPEMKKFADMIAAADDEYMPGGPPMSPLTHSFFTSWAVFDACVGAETVGTVALEAGAALGMHPELLRIIGLMQDSRMGLYTVDAVEAGAVVLRELFTDKAFRAIVPAGYSGRRGEIWYVRLLPPLLGGTDYVVFTTPYVDQETPLRAWQAYLERTFPGKDLVAHARFMKYGPSRSYWNEYVFEAYASHRTEVIFLVGLPDIEASRPHSRVNS